MEEEKRMDGFQYENQSQEQTSSEEQYCGQRVEDYHDEDICKRCHFRKIDYSVGQNNLLCGECRKVMTRLRVPVPLWITVGVVLLIAAVTLSFGFVQVKEYAQYYNAERDAKNGYALEAMDYMVKILEENKADSKVAVRLADMAMEYGYFDYASYALSNHLVGKSMDGDIVNRMEQYADRLDIYYETLDYVNQAINTAGLDKVTNEEEYLLALDKYYTILTDAYSSAETKYDKALLDYQMYYATIDEKLQEKHLSRCLEESDYQYYEAIGVLATYKRRAGDYDEAKRLLEIGYSKTKENAFILRSYAAYELVAGDIRKGLKYAEAAYDYDFEYQSVPYAIDTYIIALHANGKVDEAKEIKDYWTSQGYAFEEDLVGYLTGKISLKKYYAVEKEE